MRFMAPQVPILEVKSAGAAPVYVTQSLAICETLEELYPTPPMLPSTPLDRAVVRSICAFVASSIQPFQNRSTLVALKRLTAPSATRTPESDAVVEVNCIELSMNVWLLHITSIMSVRKRNGEAATSVLLLS